MLPRMQTDPSSDPSLPPATAPLPARQLIDLASYPRAAILRAFVDRQLPQFSITCEVDVTGIHRAYEAAGLGFFLPMSHAVSRAVNAVPQLRHRVIDGLLYEYERTDPGFTVAREGDLFSFCDGVHDEDFARYCADNGARMAAVVDQPDLTVRAKHHMFFISCLPWLSFTGFTHPYDPIYAYVPIVTLGKFTRRSTREGEAVVMPVGMQVHHGTVDGVHVARFYRELERLAADAAAWIRPPA